MLRKAAVALLLGVLGFSSPSHAANRYLEVPPVETATASRAYQYANLSNEEAFAELARRNIPYEAAEPRWGGVRAPIRLTGPLHGVQIHGVLPPEQRRQSPYEILDARLALALDDFCALLASHDIVEIVHLTMYRPAGELSEQLAPLTRHPGGMAIDVGGLRKRNGRLLAVGPHWTPSIGSKTCGSGGRELKTRPGKELLSLVCEAADLRIFHYILTPHFDDAHADHLHLEIKPEVKWFLVN